MKIFISSDIEGTNGIASWSETDKSKPGEYNYYAAKMSDEVASVCKGINTVYPDSDILVKDAHSSARNIDHLKLPQNVRLNRSWSGAPASMINCLDSSFDATIFTGYHSPAYTNGNPLAHTISGSKIAKVVINGIIAGEFHMYYYASLSLGVPVIMVSGDKNLMRLVNETDKDIVTVATLEGYGNSTTSEHPDVSLQKLQSGAKEAAEKIPHLKSLVSQKLPKSFEISITYKEHATAFRATYFPGVYKIDDMTVGYKCTEYFDFMKAWMFL